MEAWWVIFSKFFQNATFGLSVIRIRCWCCQEKLSPMLTKYLVFLPNSKCTRRRSDLESEMRPQMFWGLSLKLKKNHLYAKFKKIQTIITFTNTTKSLICFSLFLPHLFYFFYLENIHSYFMHCNIMNILQVCIHCCS